MTPSEIRAGVLQALLAIAPEVDPDALSPARPLRQQVDLDSMDWLNVMLGLNAGFGVDIPEADYAGLVSIDAIVDYLARRLAGTP